jgi:hypothetical protein
MKQLIQMKVHLILLLIMLINSFLSFAQTTEKTQGYEDSLEQHKITKKSKNAQQLLGMIGCNLYFYFAPPLLQNSINNNFRLCNTQI